jgi:DNA-binding XRE family transcriptional regulator
MIKAACLDSDKRLFCVLEREPFRERRCLEMGFPTINLTRTGANIIRLRKAAGLTVHDLQMVFGFNSPQAIYKWQNGAALPTVDNLIVLAALLHVRIDDILITDDAVA